MCSASTNRLNRLRQGNAGNRNVVIFGVLMLVGLLALAWIGSPPRSSAIGEPLPELDLQPLVGAETPLQREDLQGKVSVLHFWGTWCPPCRREFPEFVELANEFDSDPQVMVISISCSGGPEYDLDGLKSETIDFLNEFNASVPTYSDAAAMTRQKIALLNNGSFGYPTTLVVDQAGLIVETLDGYLPGEMQKLAGEIRRLADNASTGT